MSHTARTNQRVALYARVSTTRQAESELSIPDQINQWKAFCATRALRLVETFIEPGASATDDRRPEFQRMVDAATGSTRPFDLIVVHSMSRFFRDQFYSEMYIRKLKKVLAVDEAGAAVVREIFDLALGRAAMPLGVKAIVNRMNGTGRQNRGKPFHISSIHRILTATTYAGIHHFNRREARLGRSKESSEWIALTVPSIIATEDFEAVQASLHSRNPKRVPPRVVEKSNVADGPRPVRDL